MQTLNNDDILYLPNYFYYSNIINNQYLVGNPVSKKNNIISKELLSVLLLLENKKLTFGVLIKLLARNENNYIDILNELYLKGIIISKDTNIYNKFSEEILVMGRDMFQDAEKISIIKNADKVISVSGNSEILQYLNPNILISESQNYGDVTVNKEVSAWFDNFIDIVELNVNKGQNLLIIGFDGHQIFGGSITERLKKISQVNDINCRYIPSVSYIGYIYESYFTKNNPMKGFLSIDLSEFLKLSHINKNIQVIITRIGYGNGLYSTYGEGWKKQLLRELKDLSKKLLTTYENDNYIYIISTHGRNKILISDIEKSLEYWIPGYTSIFIDSY